jgi:uncharacterized membrane protein YuzA (DUF378 family)
LSKEPGVAPKGVWKKHHIAYAVLGLFGVIAFWRGAWILLDNAPVLQDPLVCAIVGLALLYLTGIIFKEFLF